MQRTYWLEGREDLCLPLISQISVDEPTTDFLTTED